jgi:hypothetical protein
MIIIPIGGDCGTAENLKHNGLRRFAFPFDWCVTYNGVSKIFKEDFANFISMNKQRLNTEYDICFPHDFSSSTYDADEAKYTRRINRLRTILESSNEPTLFFRKGHANHMHNEHNGRYTIIKSDIEDCEELYTILKSKYPSLDFSIVVTLLCDQCFNVEYQYKSNTIDVINSVMPTVDNEYYKKVFKDIMYRKCQIKL